MAYSANMYRVREVYYFRCRIPIDIRRHFQGKEDFKRSLRTKSLTVARSLLKFVAAKTERTFMMIRSGMLTPEQIAKLADVWKHETLNDTNNVRLLWHDFPDNRGELQSRIDVEELMERQAKDALVFNNLNGVQSSIVDGLIQKHNLEVVKASPDYIALSRTLMKTLIEVCQIEQQRMKGNYNNGYDDRPAFYSQSNPPETPSKRTPLLSEAIEKYIQDIKDRGRANTNSIREYESHCKLFQKALGDMPILSLTRDDIRGFYAKLRQLPTNMNKKAAYRGKSLEAILERGVPQADRLKDKTILKYEDKINGLCVWCVQEGWLDKNPADGLKQIRKKTVKDSEERSAYSKEDLQRMLEGFKKETDKGRLKCPELYLS